MNEKLQSSLAEVVAFLLKWAQDTQGFVMEQAPLIVREAIAYGRAVETWVLFVGLVFLVVGAQFLRHNPGRVVAAPAHSPDILAKGSVIPLIKSIAGGVLVVVGGITTLAQVPLVLQVWFAPRLYLLQWAADLLKQIK